MDENKKAETTNDKQSPILNHEKPKPYDLEERTYEFAREVRGFYKTLPVTVANIEDGKQLIRASGSVGANYIEANGALGKQDFVMHIKICRKESRESRYWLRLVDSGGAAKAEDQRAILVQEAMELSHIFGAILRKSRGVLTLSFLICCLFVVFYFCIFI